jgi:hypothetical protein
MEQEQKRSSKEKVVEPTAGKALAPGQAEVAVNGQVY